MKFQNLKVNRKVQMNLKIKDIHESPDEVSEQSEETYTLSSSEETQSE